MTDPAKSSPSTEVTVAPGKHRATRSRSLNAAQVGSIGDDEPVGEVHQAEPEETTPPDVLTARAVNMPAEWRLWEASALEPESDVPSTAEAVDAMYRSPSIVLTP